MIARIRDLLMRWQKVDEVALAFSLLDGAARGRVMIDVGAHTGGTLAPFAEAGWEVHAFEPEPRNVQQLRQRWSHGDRIKIVAKAVSDKPSAAVAFATSPNTYIGGLTAFDPSHDGCIEVEQVSLDGYCEEAGITRVEFLKVDAEGHDLQVLMGFPWARIRPRVVVSEFEDRKLALGSSNFKVMADLLSDQGYRVIVSEWDPIVSYEGPFVWRRFFTYPGALRNAAGNGNLIAVQRYSDYLSLRLRCCVKAVVVRGIRFLRGAYSVVRSRAAL